jgi:hypothetical protein
MECVLFESCCQSIRKQIKIKYKLVKVFISLTFKLEKKYKVQNNVRQIVIIMAFRTKFDF